MYQNENLHSSWITLTNSRNHQLTFTLAKVGSKTIIYERTNHENKQNNLHSKPPRYALIINPAKEMREKLIIVTVSSCTCRLLTTNFPGKALKLSCKLIIFNSYESTRRKHHRKVYKIHLKINNYIV